MVWWFTKLETDDHIGRLFDRRGKYFFVASFDGDFAFRSLGRKISLQIENDDQIDFDDLGNEDDEEEEVEGNTTNPRRESRGVSQVGYLVFFNPKDCGCFIAL